MTPTPTPSHYRAYAHEHGPHGFSVVGSASINGTHEDAVKMAHDLSDRCPGARVGVLKSGSGREVITIPPIAAAPLTQDNAS